MSANIGRIVAPGKASFALAIWTLSIFSLGTAIFAHLAGMFKISTPTSGEQWLRNYPLFLRRPEECSISLAKATDDLIPAFTRLTAAIFTGIYISDALQELLRRLKDHPVVARLPRTDIPSLVESIRKDKHHLQALQKQVTSLGGLNMGLLTERTSNRTRIATLEQQVFNHKQHASDMNRALEGNKIALESQKRLITQLQNQLSAAISSSTKSGVQVASLTSKNIDLQFEIEALKCTDQPETVAQSLDVEFRATAAPFVLVLVDGDAYAWSFHHFDPTYPSAGAQAAQCIRSSVKRHLLDHTARLSIHSKIVCKVFQNVSGKQMRSEQGHYRQGRFEKTVLPEFVRTFTESSPLFEYIDCGTGKERADSKIQENFHLFIANPLCQTIFLAAATDNGFARLLEQYAAIPAAKEKVVIVHPGYVVPQIAQLGYHAIEWPDVFQVRRQDPGAIASAARTERADAERQEQMKRMTARRVVEHVSGGAYCAPSARTVVGLNSIKKVRVEMGMEEDEDEVDVAAEDALD